MDIEPTKDKPTPSSKIKHTEPRFGADVPLGGSPEEVHIAESTTSAPKTIRAFEKETQDPSKWNRKPNVTGTGATHVRTFHSKLTNEALLYLDQTVNEWLDEHPEFEIKFVTTSVGELTGKLKEPHLICQVWV